MVADRQRSVESQLAEHGTFSWVESVEAIIPQVKIQETVTTVTVKAEPKVEETVKTSLKFVKVCEVINFT